MSLFRRALVLAGLAGVALLSTSAHAGANAPDQMAVTGEASRGAVYVLGNEPTGNAVVRFDRRRDGSLVESGSYPTGGTGTGGGLGSQGAVTLDDTGRYLYAVNPGSASITSFRVRRDRLELIDVVESGGAMPTSVTVHGDLVYVLNAGDPGNISGFTTRHGDLEPIADSTRPLSGTGTQPAQVSFTPDGHRLIVAERATQRFAVYTVDRDGLAAGPDTMASSGMTPFGFAFDNRDHLIVSEAMGGAVDGSAVSSYDLRRGGRSTSSARPSRPPRPPPAGSPSRRTAATPTPATPRRCRSPATPSDVMAS